MFSISAMMVSLAFAVSITATTNTNARFIICNTCEKPDDFSAEALKAAQKFGTFKVRVANADTGKIYIVTYKTTGRGDNRNSPTLISVTRETEETEIQFMDIVKAVKASTVHFSK